MAETVYKRTKLFGGALECDLPEQFADVRYARVRRVARLRFSRGNVSASRRRESSNLLTKTTARFGRSPTPKRCSSTRTVSQASSST